MEYILAYLVFELTLFYIAKRSSCIVFKGDMFPNISQELIGKFKSFDVDLGWTNKKNTVKTDFSQGKEVRYTYNSIGARSIGKFDDRESVISTYGDSYCLCREVGDDETWQYYMSKKMNSNVMNFGVGNYGIDQSLLRMKSTFPEHRADIVLLAITPYTITRISSVWKHFSEFGNFFAFKPRYILKKSKLTYLPNILKNKTQLKDPSVYKDHVLRYDDHVEYFENHVYRFPFLLSALKNFRPLLKTINFNFAKIFGKLGLSKFSAFCRDNYYYPELMYRKKLFNRDAELLNAIVDEFLSYATENKFRPVLVVLPALEDIRYCKKYQDNYYQAFVNNIEERVEVINYMDPLLKVADAGEFYVDKQWGGHFNAKANQHLAGYLIGKLHESGV